MPVRSETVLTLIFALFLLLGCNAADKLKSSNGGTNNAANTATTAKSNTSQPTVEQNEDGTIPSGDGVEKQKPAPGKGNVQGKAMFNEQPAVGVEVKLCEKFSQFVGGCSGKTLTTKTDDAGEYLIKDVTPGLYEGLTVRVFNT